MARFVVVELADDAVIKQNYTADPNTSPPPEGAITTITGVCLIEKETKAHPCEQLRKNIRFLLNMLTGGKAFYCSGPNCGAQIWFIKHPKTGPQCQ